jgi:sRNA-binding carbon storage regulator CsrA
MVKILSDFGVVRVGIEAPKHLQIVRDELIGKKQPNKQK